MHHIWNAKTTVKTLTALPSVNIHVKCRGGYYPRTSDSILRTEVSDSKTLWSVPFPDYAPKQYTAPHILSGPVYADPEIGTLHFKPCWNAKDSNIDRRSHEGEYPIVEGFPRNLRGRTGITGRGALGRWGPNHAADPVVTRWKMASGERILHRETKQPILQFVCIQRRDCGEWAIPGGMVDPGEHVSVTLQREFQEEALNSLEMTQEEKHQIQQQLKDLFHGG